MAVGDQNGERLIVLVLIYPYLNRYLVRCVSRSNTVDQVFLYSFVYIYTRKQDG